MKAEGYLGSLVVGWVVSAEWMMLLLDIVLQSGRHNVLRAGGVRTQVAYLCNHRGVRGIDCCQRVPVVRSAPLRFDSPGENETLCVVGSRRRKARLCLQP